MPHDATTSPGWRNNDPRRRPLFTPEQVAMQAAILDRLAFQVVSSSEIDRSEIAEKENFRLRIEHTIREAITQHEIEQTQRLDFPAQSIELQCFGSLSSGFATKASDMDLALLSPLSTVQPQANGSPIPRLVEKALLDAGIAARLLSRTRVPIIKLCENPPETLFNDLLAYREKWEKGETQDEHHDEDEDHEAHTEFDNANDEKEQSPIEGRHGADEAGDRVEFEVPSLDGAEPQKFYLKQGPGTTLDGYYGLAKRVLRKVGGRDVRGPTSNSMPDIQWDILNRVCEAYVKGVADPVLRQRLLQYRSLSFESPYNTHDYHSLMGVAAQIEGEHLIQQWETSIFRDAAGPTGAQVDQTIRAWISLQNRPNYGVDPAAFAKEVQMLVDVFKRMPAVQATLLTQDPNETPTQYHQRASKILREFQSHSPDGYEGLTQTFVNHYVEGIKPKELRAPVKEQLDASSGSLSLSAVARRHKSMHLAREFTKALSKSLFSDEQVNDVKQYVILLQSPLRATTKGHAIFDFVVPVTKKSSSLVNRIRDLPDPHLMAPNQPKDRYRDKLEFPKTGAGVQCDINFSAHLALQNTLLLRCYSHTDPRVRPMVLFIKHWAKMRGINSGYRGTLSSYGYVLMVLHYLVNVAWPFVCPNLQRLAPAPPPTMSPAEFENKFMLNGYNVQFWRNEEEIMHLASINQLNGNPESVGHLLRGFFEYYAQSGPLVTSNGKGFDWGREVLSLRTQGGILTKHNKGWTGAKTVYETQGDATPKAANVEQTDDTDKAKTHGSKGGEEVKEVRLRYLFAIEDPFEIDHNVARTVTHNGIVSIRDEFRRAWRLIKAAGDGTMPEDLLEDVSQVKADDHGSFLELLHEIHGPVVFDDDDDDHDS